MSEAARLRKAMVEHLVATGALRTPEWEQAFFTVPRQLFLARFFRQSADRSGWEPLAEQDPHWMELVYRDATWVTQLDNDPAGWDRARSIAEPCRGVPTSSSTAPSLMALILEALDIHGGQTVLEIGTGTGYNTALLCQRIGSELVTTVEVDPTVAESARLALAACRYTPALVVGDGTNGYADRAPYDRIIATCSAARIPPAWTTQLRPGGLLLTNLHRSLGGGALALLRRDQDGQLGGRFLPDYGGFMPLRAEPLADPLRRLTSALATVGAKVDTRATQIDFDELDHLDFGMIAALHLTGVVSIGFEPEAGPQRRLLADDGSWACVEQDRVAQFGRRRLWDDVENLHQRWTDAGQPTRSRYGLTVTATGTHRFWLDDPSNTLWADHGR